MAMTMSFVSAMNRKTWRSVSRLATMPPTTGPASTPARDAEARSATTRPRVSTSVESASSALELVIQTAMPVPPTTSSSRKPM